MDDFAALIEDAYHEHLLTRGNLDKKPRSSDWSDSTNREFFGYVARVDVKTCQSCGTIHNELLGIFSRELCPSGAIHDQALKLTSPHSFQLPPEGIRKIEYTQTSLPICADCLPPFSPTE